MQSSAEVSNACVCACMCVWLYDDDVCVRNCADAVVYIIVYLDGQVCVCCHTA